jgi:hypothetical protein
VFGLWRIAPCSEKRNPLSLRQPESFRRLKSSSFVHRHGEGIAACVGSLSTEREREREREKERGRGGRDFFCFSSFQSVVFSTTEEGGGVRYETDLCHSSVFLSVFRECEGRRRGAAKKRSSVVDVAVGGQIAKKKRIVIVSNGLPEL